MIAPRRKHSFGVGSLTKYQWLLVANCVATYVLVIVGGVVRTTGSGDACPDWPRCHGQILPPLEADVVVEFSHRLTASIVGFLVLGVAIAGLRSQRDPILRWGGVFAVGLVIGQIMLGGATVLSDLSANLVMAHLALASTLLATLLVLTLVSIAPRSAGSTAVGDRLRNLTIISGMAVFAVMMTGSYVSGSGAALAFRDWPLFDGSLVPHGGRLAMIHAAHRLAVLLLGGLMAHVALRAWRANFNEPLLRYGPAVAFALYLVQVLVGAANIWTLLQPAAAAAHLALAELLWATLVVVATKTLLLSPTVDRNPVPQPKVVTAHPRPTAAAAGDSS